MWLWVVGVPARVGCFLIGGRILMRKGTSKEKSLFYSNHASFFRSSEIITAEMEQG